MKLPKFSSKGFTLVELMVVISIIAILTVIGIVIFQNQQKGARDAKRRADVEALAQSMEAQKQAASAMYPIMATSYFSQKAMPVDPVNTIAGSATICTGGSNDSVCKYCFSLNSTPISNCSETASFIDQPATAPTSWAASATWTVCANLESGTSFCRSNAQ